MKPLPRRVLRASTPLALRLVGGSAVALGVLMVARVSAIGSGAVTGNAARWLDAVLFGLALLALATFGTGLIRLWGRGPRLVLDDVGFENRTSAMVGVRRGAWRDVVELRVEAGMAVLVLGEGRRSVVNPAPLGLDAERVAAAIRGYLSRRLS